MRRRGACAHAICNSGAAWRPSTLSSAAQGSLPPLPFQYSSTQRAGAAHSLHTLPQPVGWSGPVWNATCGTLLAPRSDHFPTNASYKKHCQS